MPSVKGFRIQQPISEQIAAMDALLAIEGRSAGEAVARLIETQTIQGPGLVDRVARGQKQARADHPAQRQHDDMAGVHLFLVPGRLGRRRL